MKSKKTSKILYAIYLLFLIWLVIFKFSTSLDGIPRFRSVNLTPFHDALNHPIRTREVIDNVLIFIPYGILITIVRGKRGLPMNTLIIFLTSLCFEAIQYIFSIGATDVNDLITNTLGGMVGIIIYKVLYRVFKGKAVEIVNLLGFIFLLGSIIIGSILFLANR